MRRLTTEEFIIKAKEIHGNKYDYSKSVYTTKKEKLIITCPIHGDFLQSPDGHLRGLGCPKCKFEKLANNQRITTEEFIEKARKVHGDKYDYSLTQYIDSRTKVCINCPEHGEFWLDPYNHLAGKGCPKCALRTISLKLTMPLEEFIRRCQEVHYGKYDYSKVVYKGIEEKVEIICPIHGSFWQRANDHLHNGSGCPKCSNHVSKGELLVENALKSLNVEFIPEKTFKNPYTDNTSFRVDFYCEVKGIKYIIEYDGILHYHPVLHFGGNLLLVKQQTRDFLLVKFCAENNFKLIRIPYIMTELQDVITLLQNCFNNNSGLAIIDVDFFYKLLKCYHE